MKYAIVTPTFRGHFNFIKVYLESFDRYVNDKENIVIYFTVNRDEVSDFKEIIRCYKDINIEILIFDDILKKNNIYLNPDNLLKKYGRFSFQTLKKFYSIMEIPERYSLVIDSESSWVNETNMGALFETFFNNPKLFCSDVAGDRLGSFAQNAQRNAQLVVGHKINKWFIETFMWYYDKQILSNMLDEYGGLLYMIDEVYSNGNRSVGLFEILVYSNYIFDNYEKYGYQIIDVTEKCEKNLSPYVWENYFFDLAYRLNGNFGVLEQAMMLLNDDNTEELATLFEKLGINILRCEIGLSNKNAVRFFEIVKPNIFAASQEHCFGVLANKRKILGWRRGLKIIFKFISKDNIKIILRKFLPGYKVACECRDNIDQNKKLLHKIIELQEENKELLKNAIK